MTGTDISLTRQGVMRDVLVNLTGKLWSALVSFFFVPFFTRLLGVEAYGLVGLFTTLQTVLLLLDFGFSTALNRALSATGRAAIPKNIQHLAGTLERVFSAFSIVILCVVFMVSPWLTTNWIALHSLDPTSVTTALQLMGLAIAVQLPFLLYAGGLSGLGRQTFLNVVMVFCVTLRFGGGLLILNIWPTILAFFAWQVLVAALQSLWARHVFFRDLRIKANLPSDGEDSFRKHYRFATGVGLTAALGVILTQLDKLMLSKLLSLADYGYYMLAWTLSSTILMLAGPVVSAFFPRLSAEVALKNGKPEDIYHVGCQLVSVAVVPAGLLLMLFPDVILNLWLGEPAVVEKTSRLLTLLTLGSLLNTFAQMPHALQLAFGFPRFGLYANILLVTLTVPALYLGVGEAGVEGAAWVWVALNAVYVVVGVPLMHLWMLQGSFMRWLWHDVLLPMGVAFSLLSVAGYLLIIRVGQAIYAPVCLVLLYMMAAGACILVLPNARDLVSTWLGLNHR